MEQLEAYIEGMFAEYPDSEETRRAKAALLEDLGGQYQRLVGEGVAPHDALIQIFIAFGTQEGVQAEVNRQKRIISYRNFREKYPRMLRWGFLGILVVPVLALLLTMGLDSKLSALAAWVVTILLLVGFVICVEYMDYHYKRVLGDDAKLALESPGEWEEVPPGEAVAQESGQEEVE